jgi:hypothetical protein
MSFLHKEQTQLFMQIANCIIPPTDNLPGAGNIDIFDNKECDLGVTPKQENHIIEFLDKTSTTSFDILESPFEDLTEANKIKILKTIESANPNLFNSMIQILYSGYYASASVLKAKHLPAKAFQPDGFNMEPFEESSVTKVLNRGKKYRDSL